MPHTEQAKKRLKQNRKRREQNRAVKSELKTQVKKVLTAVKTGDAKAADEQLKLAFKKLDKSGARRHIHPNAAARSKSRLAKRVQALKAAKPAG